MRRLGRVGLRLLREQSGISLLEIVLALGILGLIGIAFLSGLNTASRGTGIHEERITALSLAQSQIEEIKPMPYDPTGNYPVVITAPSSYDISVSTVPEPPEATDKQKVTVTISRGGEFILKLTAIKLDKTGW